MNGKPSDLKNNHHTVCYTTHPSSVAIRRIVLNKRKDTFKGVLYFHDSALRGTKFRHTRGQKTNVITAVSTYVRDTI